MSAATLTLRSKIGRTALRQAFYWFALGLIVAHTAGCAGAAYTSAPTPEHVSVSIAPGTANVRAGAAQPFSATVTGASHQNVNWSVNGVAGGSASTGTITA